MNYINGYLKGDKLVSKYAHAYKKENIEAVQISSLMWQGILLFAVLFSV